MASNLLAMTSNLLAKAFNLLAEASGRIHVVYNFMFLVFDHPFSTPFGPSMVPLTLPTASPSCAFPCQNWSSVLLFLVAMPGAYSII